MALPTNVSSRTRRSITPPRRAAVSTPSGTDTTSASSRLPAASTSVFPMQRMSFGSTGIPSLYDAPKSPRSTPSSQSP